MMENERTMVEKVENEGVIGSDEVGKVEPFKQLMVVAVYADPDVPRTAENGNELNTGDSKKNSGAKERAIKLGKMLTGFENFDEIEDKVYTNEKYGLIYYIKIIPNEVYNEWEAKNTSKKRYGNALLAYAHNEALRKVYEEVKAQGKRVANIVVDDFISTKTPHKEQFREYTGWIAPETECVTQLSDIQVIMEDHAEDKYRHTVGAASNIGDYVDQLWHKKVIAAFQECGVPFKSTWFDNFHSQSEVNYVFNLIAEKCGDVDKAPVTVKHTEYYKRWKKIEK